MKNALVVIAAVIVFLLLMVLPGFVFYIVGDIVNKMIPGKKEGASA